MTRLATDSEGAAKIKTTATIGVAGCTGRVGKLIVRELQSGHWRPTLSLAGGTIRPGFPLPDDEDVDFHISHDPEDLFQRADIIIDFTTPEASAKHIWLAAKHCKPLVIGTTGLNEAQEQELKDAAKEAPILHATNMSIGVNLLEALIEQVAARLDEQWDIEIAESHHRYKIDAPSGTALTLGKAAARGRKVKFDPVTNRNGERESGTIGFSVRRGGDIVGEHTAGFYADGERLELTHKASDRALFAKGALRAALWLKDQRNGLYTMRDVLNL